MAIRCETFITLVLMAVTLAGHSADVGRLLAYLGFSLLAESVAKGVSSYATHLAVFTLSLSFL